MRAWRGLGVVATLMAAAMVLSAAGSRIVSDTTVPDTLPLAADKPSGKTEEASALAAAKANGKRAEVLGSRSETRQVFAEPNGTFTMELSPQPVRVKKGADWVPVDTALKKQPDGTVAPEASMASVKFSGGGSEAPLVQLANGTKRIELRWPEPLPAPTLAADTATYPEVFAGVDLKLRATAQGFSDVLVVKTPQAAKDPRLARIRFGLRTEDLTLSVNEYGGLSAKDTTGTVVFESSKVEMWDSSRTHLAVGRVEVSAGQLAVIPDQSLLGNPEATYPIMIDPDFYPPGVGWTKVFSGYPNNGYWNGGGDDGLAKVGYCGWAGCGTPTIGKTRSFFQFDISALRGAQIFGAEFNVHEVWAPSCTARVFEVWQVGPIGGGTTWNNQPGGWWGPLGSPNVAYGYNGNCPANWVGVPAGQSVINRLNDGSNVATFALKARDQEEADKMTWKKFDAGSLIVHYNWAPNVPSGLWSNVGQGPSLGCANDPANSYTFSPRPTLRATLSDPDGHNLEANFEWHVWNGGFVGSTRTAFQPNGTAHAAVIPDGAFGHDGRIAWRVRGGDGYIWGPWSQWCGLTVDTRPPSRPSVTSTDYPQDQVGGYIGKTGSFTVTAADSDVLGFQWSLNFQDFPVVDVNSPYFVRATNGVATVRATPTKDGPNDLYVRAVDRALNVSPAYQKPDGNGGWVPGGYHFIVGSAVPPPVGHWPLDGVHHATTAADASGRGHQGTVTGIYPASGAAWTTGRIGDALRFDGAGGHVTTAGGPTVNTAATFTVAAWVRLDQAGDLNYGAVSQDGVKNSGFTLHYLHYSRKFSFTRMLDDTGPAHNSRVESDAPAPVGVWTHLLGSYDSGSKELRLYVNGVRQVANTQVLQPVAWNATGPLVIGRAKWNGGIGDWWPGAIDDVKAWDRLLTDTEIAHLANTPTTEEAFYPFDEGTGSRTAEVSGNYRTGTLSAGVSWVPGVVGDAAVKFNDGGTITTTQQAVRTDRSYTVTARVRLDAANDTFQTVVSQDGPNSSGFALQYLPSTRKWAMVVSPADAANPQWISAQSALPAQAGEWVNLAGVHDVAKGEIRLYVNGVEHITPARITANIPGNLVLGRAKQSGVGGGLVAFLSGRVDDVHVYSGVRTKDEIIADSLNPVTARPTVYSGQLSRYVGHDARHFITNGPVPPGQRFEWPLGLLAPPGAADTRMLYSCQYSGGQFVSLQSNCEGYTLLSEIGLVYRNPPADVPTRAIYRCLVVATGDHFNSPHTDCEGHHNEGLQGYTRNYRYLIRYIRDYPPHDHAASTTIVGLAAGYSPEGVLGIVADSAEPNAQGLMSCYDGVDEFLSNDANCEGKTVRWWVGNAWQVPPPYAQESMRIYGCRVGTAGERFTSLDEFCEGQTIIGSLGYVITRL